jgi:hypothetical protein
VPATTSPLVRSVPVRPPCDGAALRDTFGIAIVVAAFWALPAAIVAAVLRYRLYEIDRLVSRTVSYVVVVAVLVTVYVALVYLVSSVMPRRGDLAVVSSTLAVAALFDPLRRRVRVAVDRRFDRPRYGREREVARYLGRLRDEVTMDAVRHDLVEVVGATVGPRSASLWLAADGPVPPAHRGREGGTVGART